MAIRVTIYQANGNVITDRDPVVDELTFTQPNLKLGLSTRERATIFAKQWEADWVSEGIRYAMLREVDLPDVETLPVTDYQ